MSPIQRDGIHAYILLPREFKRQRRSSRLKAIQSLFFLPSSPPNSFWAIKFKNSNVHYNLWGCSTSNSLEMLCSMSLNFFFFGVRKSVRTFFFYFLGGGGRLEDIVCLTWLCHWWCMPNPVVFLVSVWLGWAAGVARILAPYLIALLRNRQRVMLPYKTKMPLQDQTAPLLFQLQRLNVFAPSKTKSQSNGTQ